MRITVKRLNEAYLMEAQNEDGASIRLDTSKEHGATENAFRPMQLLLAGVGSCSMIDIVDIIKKQRQTLKHIEVLVDGEREKDKTPSLYETVHLHYILHGNLDHAKTEAAIELSLGKYCSVAQTLDKTAKITYTFEIHEA